MAACTAPRAIPLIVVLSVVIFRTCTGPLPENAVPFDIAVSVVAIRALDLYRAIGDQQPDKDNQPRDAKNSNSVLFHHLFYANVRGQGTRHLVAGTLHPIVGVTSFVFYK